MTRSGVVYLVGAGPGGPELLTQAGRRRLERAECVFYDKLVDPRTLELAPAEAERIYVGKVGNAPHHCTPQETINALLIEKALSGKTVVRLKGGDPLLFARGGEEAMALRQAGVRYEIIPGVTAALAAAACAGVPLTHRSCSSAVAFITGHEDPAKSERLDWEAVAHFPGTLVLYMGLQRIGSIARELLAHGKSAATPVAFVEWAGTNRQKVRTTDLSLAIAGPPSDLDSPVVTLIGDVCNLRDSLEWFESRPLFGQTVLVLRPPGQTEPVVRRLEELGAQARCEPVFRIEPPDDWKPVDAAMGRLDQTDWIVFSSSNGVQFFLDRLLQQGGDLRLLGRCKIAAIGPGTAAALWERHLRADVVPEQFRAEALAEALADEVKGQRVLLVRADRGRTVLYDELSKTAAQVSSIVAYRQVDVEKPSDATLADLRAGRIQWVMLSSSNMARGFARWLDAEAANVVRRTTKLATISPLTSDAAREVGFEPAAEATVYTLDGIVDAIEALVEKMRGL